MDKTIEKWTKYMQNSQTTPNTQQTKRYLNILVVQQMQMEAMTT